MFLRYFYKDMGLIHKKVKREKVAIKNYAFGYSL